VAVIVDTSPLNYLVLVGAEEALAGLQRQVLIPEPVLLELRHPEPPKIVAEWAARLPAWIEVVSSSAFAIESELTDLEITLREPEAERGCSRDEAVRNLCNLPYSSPVTLVGQLLGHVKGWLLE
jgi:hypothetical protein